MSAINKKKINSRIKKPHLKMIPIKDNGAAVLIVNEFLWGWITTPSTCNGFLTKVKWI